MEDSFGVHVIQREHYLVDHWANLFLGQSIRLILLSSGEHVEQVASRNVLHHYVDVRLVFHQIKDSDNVWVLQLLTDVQLLFH